MADSKSGNIWFELKGIEKINFFFENFPETVHREVNKDIPTIMKTTKRIVKRKLRKGNGVNEGIYKKSIIYKRLTDSTEIVEFVVGGNKRHYRLTHLIENGHRIKSHGRFIPGKTTKAIPHIQYGQAHADKAVLALYDKALDKALKNK